MEKTKKQYQTPQVELFEAHIERGFAGSMGPEENPPVSNNEQLDLGSTYQYN